MSKIGIMQGRLSPPEGGRIQSFPVNTWREEFALAKQAELDCIEWIYEEGTEPQNPLKTASGIEEIKKAVKESGVAVRSVCADYYMTRRLIAPDGKPVKATVHHLKGLIEQAGLLSVKYIVLPFVDSSSLKSIQELEGLVLVLKEVAKAAERKKIELHLETDLVPVQLAAILKIISHPLVHANYDIGNSASLRHDPTEIITILKSHIGSVHVKDRVRGGGTVPLGTGAADFQTTFRLLCSAGYKGTYILQAAREQGLSEVALAIRNRQFVEKQLAAVKCGA